MKRQMKSDVAEKKQNLKASERIFELMVYTIEVAPTSRVLECMGGRTMGRLSLGITILLVLASMSLALARQQTEHGGRPLTANLTGAAEVPGPGDADGAGSAKITLNQGKGQVCYELTVSNIATANAAHIHVGASTVAGPVLVGLDPPANGSSKGCVDLDKEKFKDLIQNPANYYVNVHNAEFPDGAVRGQLSK